MSVEPLIPASGAGPPDGPDEGGGGTEPLWTGERRRLIVGLVLTITLVAFEALAIATVMPDVKDDLGGLGLYGWVFSAFFLTSLLGIVVAGQLADRHGLVLPYVAGLGLFAAGLVVGGAAQSMPMLILGRALQGFGAGAIPATGYAAIGRGIPTALRPRMFAVLSTAWVLPGVIGPTTAIFIERVSSWRAVFLVLIPFVVVACVLTVPGLAALDAAADDRDDDDEQAAARQLKERLHLRQVGLLVAGVGAVFGATTTDEPLAAVALVVVGVPIAAGSLVHLLPKGTLRLAPGVPATVAVRGMLTFAFFAADAYVPLAVVDGRNADSWLSGLALTASCLAWAGASWVQARLIDRLGPRRIDQMGFALLVLSGAILLAVAQGAWVPLVIAAWAVGGFGIGFAYAPQAVTVLASAAPGEEGSASAAIQLSDGLGVALGTGLAGGIISYGASHDWTVARSVTGVFALAIVAAAAGLVAAGRLPERVPDQAT